MTVLFFFFFFQTLCTFACVRVEGELKRREGKVYSRAGVMANKLRTHEYSNRSDGKRKEKPPLLLEDKQGSPLPINEYLIHLLAWM